MFWLYLQYTVRLYNLNERQAYNIWLINLITTTLQCTYAYIRSYKHSNEHKSIVLHKNRQVATWHEDGNSVRCEKAEICCCTPTQTLLYYMVLNCKQAAEATHLWQTEAGEENLHILTIYISIYMYIHPHIHIQLHWVSLVCCTRKSRIHTYMWAETFSAIVMSFFNCQLFAWVSF